MIPRAKGVRISQSCLFQSYPSCVEHYHVQFPVKFCWTALQIPRWAVSLEKICPQGVVSRGPIPPSSLRCNFCKKRPDSWRIHRRGFHHSIASSRNICDMADGPPSVYNLSSLFCVRMISQERATAEIAQVGGAGSSHLSSAP